MLKRFQQIGTRQKVMLVLGVLLLVISVPLGWNWLHYQLNHATTNNAFVESDLINISPLVSGHLKETLVEESDVVKDGQVVALIDDEDYQAQVALKESQLNKVDRDLSTLQTTLERTKREVEEEIVLAGQGVMEAEESLRSATAEGNRIEADYVRFKNLIERQVISESRFDAVEAQYISSQASVKSSKILVKMKEIQLKRTLIGRQRVEELEKKVQALEAARETARKALEVVALNLEHTRIKSPITGVVAKKWIHEGDFISPGFPIFSVYDQENIYITANLEEVKMGGVKLGQTVDIEADAYPGTDFKGKVIKVGTASIAKFALIPRDTSAGEFTKVVQRIPIKISVEDPDRLLRPGLSVRANIKVK